MRFRPAEILLDYDLHNRAGLHHRLDLPTIPHAEVAAFPRIHVRGDGVVGCISRPARIATIWVGDDEQANWTCVAGDAGRIVYPRCGDIRGARAREVISWRVRYPGPFAPDIPCTGCMCSGYAFDGIAEGI